MDIVAKSVEAERNGKLRRVGGDIRIEAGDDAKIKAKDDVAFTAYGRIDLTADQLIDIYAKGEIEDGKQGRREGGSVNIEALDDIEIEAHDDIEIDFGAGRIDMNRRRKRVKIEIKPYRGPNAGASIRVSGRTISLDADRIRVNGQSLRNYILRYTE